MTQDARRLYEQAMAAQQAGRLTEAASAWNALAALTGAGEAHVNHGNALAKLGQRGAALAAYDAALARDARLLPALFNRANLLAAMLRVADALADYDRALAVKPDIAGIWNNRGVALRALSRHAGALASFERAAALDSTHVNALTNIAIALNDLGRQDEALAAVERALAARPGFAEALYVKGTILTAGARHGDALAQYEAALAADARHPRALNGAAAAALALCDWPRVAAYRPRLEAAVEGGSALVQPFTLLGYGAAPALQRQCAERWMARAAPVQAPLWTGTRYGHDRIRLAYLSADFHQHPTAALMVALFERHDRSRFEITAISFGPDDGSDLRARLVKAFDHFHDVRGQSDAEVAQAMREAEIDIAIDLNGHTLNGRPGILAWRPAPVAVNYLVYPGTTGAPFIDFILADDMVLPQSQQAFFTETIRHLPRCYQPSDTRRVVAPAPPRTALGLPEDGFVFCCFNAGWKITAPVFDIWMRLLATVPGAVLWLLDGPHAGNLRGEASARGIDPARLIFAPKADPAAHLARHGAADLFLDSWPYGAHTTASDALWAGLPLVTVLGEQFPARVGASLLTAIDLPELIAQTPQDYEALALDLARDPARLAALRQTLAQNRRTAPLFDSAAFQRDYEDALAALIA